MKSFIMIFSLFISMHTLTFGKIINGYASGIQEARNMLIHLQTILAEDTYNNNTLSSLQKVRLQASIERTKTYVLYYHLTEKLLERFSTIAPDLYYEIDVITDAKGRVTDVYVKFMPENEMRVSLTGTTDMAQAAVDRDACASEYGVHTVSVKVGVRSNALEQLAHEFGHIQYQVPHLAEYAVYYNKHYKQTNDAIRCIGHKANDPSGQYAHAYAKKFWQQARVYHKTTGAKSPVALLQEIKRSMNEQANS